MTTKLGWYAAVGAGASVGVFLVMWGIADYAYRSFRGLNFE